MKECAYEDRYLGEEFVPLAVETYGCMSQPFVDLLRLCARQAVGRYSGEGLLSVSSVVTFNFKPDSVALQRAQAVAIVRRSAAVEGVGAALPPLPPPDPTSIFDVGHVRVPPRSNDCEA